MTLLKFHLIGNVFCIIDNEIIWCDGLSMISAANLIEKLSNPSKLELSPLLGPSGVY